MDQISPASHVQQFGTLARLQRGWSPGQPPSTKSVSEVLATGATLGLGAVVGSYGQIIGEATMIDGVFWCTGRDGSIRPMEPQEQLAFWQATELPKGSQSIKIKAQTPDELLEQCQALLPDNQRNGFALQLVGDFRAHRLPRHRPSQ